MAPFTPFLAEEIFQAVKWDSDPESVHLELWSDPLSYVGEGRGEVFSYMETVRDIVTLGLEARQKENIKVRQPLASITISQSLSNDYIEILKDELNVKEVVIDESLAKGEVKLDIKITDELRAEGDMRDMIRRIQDMRKDADLVPSDVVIVTLTDTLPAWFIEYENLQNELLRTVGAREIVWVGESDRVEKV
jgi:isoleucyl-tRNA synthetase